MVIALTVLHVLMCFAIIGMVLFLQSGKGADIGSAFGGAGSQAVFGS
ncbi:MAG TPA: preprotein translocase subunit SecG, partial [Methylomirabilota bacterium]|nr:preprotein translocase subunit SecG [Methylomirabilota bacterium]